MKTTVFVGLIVAALSSTAFAMDNKELCAAHIQKIQDTVASPGNMSRSIVQRAKSDMADAQKAQKAGDDQKCLDITLRSLMKIRQYMN
ncbi:hypothetical protein ACIPL1_07195 [Pseudomonas sp. NPDC090202]|uniref:hypothetical protein n=1 Tax=unclassified Pseudomonas TaxID=196821 RepID=UPI003811A260